MLSFNTTTFLQPPLSLMAGFGWICCYYSYHLRHHRSCIFLLLFLLLFFLRLVDFEAEAAGPAGDAGRPPPPIPNGYAATRGFGDLPPPPPPPPTGPSRYRPMPDRTPLPPPPPGPAPGSGAWMAGNDRWDQSAGPANRDYSRRFRDDRPSSNSSSGGTSTKSHTNKQFDGMETGGGGDTVFLPSTAGLWREKRLAAEALANGTTNGIHGGKGGAPGRNSTDGTFPVSPISSSTESSFNYASSRRQAQDTTRPPSRGGAPQHVPLVMVNNPTPKSSTASSSTAVATPVVFSSSTMATASVRLLLRVPKLSLLSTPSSRRLGPTSIQVLVKFTTSITATATVVNGSGKRSSSSSSSSTLADIPQQRSSSFMSREMSFTAPLQGHYDRGGANSIKVVSSGGRVESMVPFTLLLPNDDDDGESGSSPSRSSKPKVTFVDGHTDMEKERGGETMRYRRILEEEDERRVPTYTLVDLNTYLLDAPLPPPPPHSARGGGGGGRGRKSQAEMGKGGNWRQFGLVYEKRMADAARGVDEYYVPLYRSVYDRQWKKIEEEGRVLIHDDDMEYPVGYLMDGRRDFRPLMTLAEKSRRNGRHSSSSPLADPQLLRRTRLVRPNLSVEEILERRTIVYDAREPTPWPMSVATRLQLYVRRVSRENRSIPPFVYILHYVEHDQVEWHWVANHTGYTKQLRQSGQTLFMPNFDLRFEIFRMLNVPPPARQPLPPPLLPFAGGNMNRPPRTPEGGGGGGIKMRIKNEHELETELAGGIHRMVDALNAFQTTQGEWNKRAGRNMRYGGLHYTRDVVSVLDIVPRTDSIQLATRFNTYQLPEFGARTYLYFMQVVHAEAGQGRRENPPSTPPPREGGAVAVVATWRQPDHWTAKGVISLLERMENSGEDHTELHPRVSPLSGEEELSNATRYLSLSFPYSSSFPPTPTSNARERRRSTSERANTEPSISKADLNKHVASFLDSLEKTACEIEASTMRWCFNNTIRRSIGLGEGTCVQNCRDGAENELREWTNLRATQRSIIMRVLVRSEVGAQSPQWEEHALVYVDDEENIEDEKPPENCYRPVTACMVNKMNAHDWSRLNEVGLIRRNIELGRGGGLKRGRGEQDVGIVTDTNKFHRLSDLMESGSTRPPRSSRRASRQQQTRPYTMLRLLPLPQTPGEGGISMAHHALLYRDPDFYPQREEPGSLVFYAVAREKIVVEEPPNVEMMTNARGRESRDSDDGRLARARQRILPPPTTTLVYYEHHIGYVVRDEEERSHLAARFPPTSPSASNGARVSRMGSGRGRRRTKRSPTAAAAPVSGAAAVPASADNSIMVLHRHTCSDKMSTVDCGNMLQEALRVVANAVMVMPLKINASQRASMIPHHGDACVGSKAPRPDDDAEVEITEGVFLPLLANLATGSGGGEEASFPILVQVKRQDFLKGQDNVVINKKRLTMKYKHQEEEFPIGYLARDDRFQPLYPTSGTTRGDLLTVIDMPCKRRPNPRKGAFLVRFMPHVPFPSPPHRTLFDQPLLAEGPKPANPRGLAAQRYPISVLLPVTMQNRSGWLKFEIGHLNLMGGFSAIDPVKFDEGGEGQPVGLLVEKDSLELKYRAYLPDERERDHPHYYPLYQLCDNAHGLTFPLNSVYAISTEVTELFDRERCVLPQAYHTWLVPSVETVEGMELDEEHRERFARKELKTVYTYVVVYKFDAAGEYRGLKRGLWTPEQIKVNEDDGRFYFRPTDPTALGLPRGDFELGYLRPSHNGGRGDGYGRETTEFVALRVEDPASYHPVEDKMAKKEIRIGRAPIESKVGPLRAIAHWGKRGYQWFTGLFKGGDGTRRKEMWRRKRGGGSSQEDYSGITID